MKTYETKQEIYEKLKLLLRIFWEKKITDLVFSGVMGRNKIIEKHLISINIGLKSQISFIDLNIYDHITITTTTQRFIYSPGSNIEYYIRKLPNQKIIPWMKFVDDLVAYKFKSDYDKCILHLDELLVTYV